LKTKERELQKENEQLKLQLKISKDEKEKEILRLKKLIEQNNSSDLKEMKSLGQSTGVLSISEFQKFHLDIDEITNFKKNHFEDKIIF